MENLSGEEAEAAKRMALIAERAEAKAMERLKAEGIKSSNIPSLAPSTKFLTKKERQELALTKLQIRRDSEVQRAQSESLAHSRFVTGAAAEERNLLLKRQREEEELNKLRREKEENKKSNEHDHEVKTIRDHYLGGGEKKRKIVKPSEKFARIFKFNWEADDDTMKNDVNPLYVNRTKINALYGRGYIAGVDLREQRKTSNFLTTLNEKRSQELRSGGFSSSNVSGSSDYNGNLRVGMSVDALAPAHPHSAVVKPKRYRCGDDDGLAGCHWRDKSLEQMTERDWRIFREDYDIRIKHGRATHPLRSWKESTLHPCFLDAVADLGYKEPSPIQRQAIPVGLLKRDMIGIAETGSGKTAAFLIPLLAYLQDLPAEYIARVDVEGPLALIMAPVRELAQQIEGACQKLAKYTKFRSLSIVGGESIAEQSNKLRQGVEIVVGTPGRLLDCINSHYMVLSQCNYLVLDEADRMIDMGFEETLVQIIDNMGGLLKAEDEEQAVLQEEEAVKGEKVYRVTAMFSATMPPEVEMIAKNYLRHPVIVKIGDEDSGKNKRIEQIIVVLDSEKRKANKLLEDARKLTQTDKLIVFVNLKKTAESVAIFLEKSGFAAGVLHGGRSQDQREETLEYFRQGRSQILVATDVAARGLDIPDVTHVINYDMATKIQPYCHRIGRTGRAGKSGIATTYLTDEDSDVMFELKNYLESTNAAIPIALSRHPAAQCAVGSRDDRGALMGTSRKDSIMYTRE